MYDVITIGDCMRDIFLFPSLEEMEKPLDAEKINAEDYDKYLVFGLGDKVTISDAEYSIGGTANNVACALSKMGFKASLCSAMGNDLPGIELKKEISEQKVDLSQTKIYSSKKTSFSVIVCYKGERTIFVYHSFGPENFKLEDQINSRWVYLGPMAKGYEGLFARIVSLKIKKNFQVAVNPGSIQIKAGLHSFGGLLHLIDIIFLNKEEAKEISGLSGISTIKELAEAIAREGPKTVVITDGKNGAYGLEGEDFLRVGAYPGHRLESTGAGDAFASAFLGAKISGENLQIALKWGVTNSASVIGKVGAQTGLLGRNTIKRRVKEYKWPADTLRFS